MFIVSPTKGGYRGDVNTAFRTGRKEAFDDYINSYNKALQADNNTYNFNQRVVRDTANNYILQNNMAQDARDEALDFTKKSTDIAEAQFNFDRKKAELDWTNQNGGAEVMGNVDGKLRQTEAFDKVTKAGQDYNRTQQFRQQEINSGSDAKISGNEVTAMQNGLKQRLMLASDQPKFIDNSIKAEVKRMQEQGDNRSPTEIEAEIRADQTKMDAFEQKRQQEIKTTQDGLNYLQQTTTKQNKQDVPKYTSSKVDFGTDAMKPVVDFVNEQLKPYGKDITSFQEGDAFMGPKGEIYQVIGGTPHALNFKDAQQRALFVQSMRKANIQQPSKPTGTPGLGGD